MKSNLGYLLGLSVFALSSSSGCASDIDSNTLDERHSEAESAITAAAVGGSNYSWYAISGCDREPYGIIFNYHVPNVRSQVQSQLAQMHASGQHRLRINIFHGRGLSTGTVMDSTGGNLSATHRTNLATFLADIKNAAFGEIEVAFHPIGLNEPLTWSQWKEDLYQENWNLIFNLRPIISAAGILYRIDLMNEGTPTSSQDMLRQYVKRLWGDYNFVFGKNDTVGFSIIGDSIDRISQIPVIYGNNKPYLFDLHFYGNAQQTEQQQFIAAHNKMKALGLASEGWIIGEAFYNDSVAANGIYNAMNATGRTVFYLTQWPLQRNSPCQHVNLAPPSAFNNYTAKSF
jgi:hypothetical protein